MLWQGWQDGRQLIELPSTHRSESVKALIEQLVTWHPAAPKTQKTDCVMSLWFVELVCRDRLQLVSSARTHQKNMFSTRGDIASQRVISLWDPDVEGMWRSL
jgi:hypothetical protein